MIPQAKVLMLGYMNEEALNATLSSGMVTFTAGVNDDFGLKGETVVIFLQLISDIDRLDMTIRY